MARAVTRYQDLPDQLGHGVPKLSGPTPKQMWVLRFIDAHVRERGYAPSTRELCEAMGVRTNAVAETLARLEVKGLLTHEPGKARTLQLTAAGRRALKEAG